MFLTRNRIHRDHSHGCSNAELHKWMKHEEQERKQKGSVQAVEEKEESLQPKYPVQVEIPNSPIWIEELAKIL